MNEERSMKSMNSIGISNNGQWMSAKQSADYIMVSDRKLRSLCKLGRLRYAQPSKKLMFRRSWLDAYILGFGKRLTPTERKELEELS